jgi:hypothetical protein
VAQAPLAVGCHVHCVAVKALSDAKVLVWLRIHRRHAGVDLRCRNLHAPSIVQGYFAKMNGSGGRNGWTDAN